MAGAHGGKRKGAGRKSGQVSERTKAERERVEEIKAELEAEGATPLDYMLDVLRDPKADEKRKDAMAVAAAPYIHAKLASITVDPGKDAKDWVQQLLGAIAARPRALTPQPHANGHALNGSARPHS